MKVKPITGGGRSYPSMKDAASALGVKLNTVSCRLRQGWNIDEAFGLQQRPPSKTQGEEFVVRGRTFRSRAEASRAFDLSPQVVHFRLQKGWTVEQAFGFEEVAYQTKPKVVFRVDKYVLNAPVNRYGWTMEQAIGVAPRPGHVVGVAGIVYLVECLHDWRKYIGVTMGTVEERWQGHVRQAFSERSSFCGAAHRDSGYGRRSVHSSSHRDCRKPRRTPRS
jgi:hypothetical protein